MRLSQEEVRFIEPGLVDYHEAWAMQQQLAAARIGDGGRDSVILLQHPDVYTAGRRTEAADRPAGGTPVVDVDRGGKITWHGPGQLVGYPIIGLADPARVVDYVDMLEQVLIDACARVGVSAGRVPGRSGVWLPEGNGSRDRKIAAIGIRIAKGVTGHGFALNCDCDLTAFDTIVPCGIADAGVTSLTVEAGRRVTVSDMQPIVKDLLVTALDDDYPRTDAVVPRLALEGTPLP